ncbi:hypothetical protein ACWDGI_41735 [Streptomyces sp. NPDC001220]
MPKWLETYLAGYFLSLVVMEWTCLSVMPTPTVWRWLYVALVMGPVAAFGMSLYLSGLYGVIMLLGRRGGR